jgi:hypothetical protein
MTRGRSVSSSEPARSSPFLRNAKHDLRFAPESPDNIDEAAAESGLSLTEGQRNAVISFDFKQGRLSVYEQQGRHG